MAVNPSKRRPTEALRAGTPYQHVMRSLEVLRPFGKNARRHGDEQIAKLVRAIKEFGFTSPLIIDDKDHVLAGYGRLMAAREIPLTEVPCIVVTGLTTPQKHALALSDNRIALESSWDQDILIETLGEITAEGLDITLSGFDALEIGQFLSPLAIDDVDADPDGDGTPKPQSITVSVPSAIDIPSVAATLRKALKAAGYRGVKVREPT